MDKLAKIVAAACGAVLSFITGLPPLMWVLLGVMCLDYVTGLMCGLVGVSPRRRAAAFPVGKHFPA